MTSPQLPGDGTRSPGEWWRGLRPWTKGLLGAVAAILGINAGLAGLEAVTGGAGPGGPTSSSYATSAEGMAALAELVGDAGHPVRRIRAGLDEAGLDPAGTLVLADLPGITGPELEAVAGFVEGGGRLVVAGDGAAELTEAITGDGPVASAAPPGSARPIAPVAEVAGVTSVVSGGLGAFAPEGDGDDGTGATLPVLAGEDRILAVVADVGSGRLVAIADASPWHNRLLARADNAAFALAALGELGRPVAFAEAHHGYGAASGIGALPGEWKWALAIGFAAALAAMWAKGRRLGPAEILERELPPPRRAYVDAIASTLVRTRQPAEALAPLQAAARRRLIRQAGLAPDAGADDLRRAATRAGLSDEELAAVLAPVTRDDQVLAAGRALARLEGADR